MAKEKHPKKSQTQTKPSSINGCMKLLRNMDRDQLLQLLSEGFCQHCEAHLETRVRSFIQTEKVCDDNAKECEDALWPLEEIDRTDKKKINSQSYIRTPEPIRSPRKKVQLGKPLPASLNNDHYSLQQPGSEEVTYGGAGRHSSLMDEGLSEAQENIRASQMRRKGDFCCLERIDGRFTNVLEGLELYTGVFNLEEQKKIAEFVYDLQDKGRKRQLRGRTYSEPRKWMRGKGRVTIQFGCCYNYAEDKYGNPPGIVRDAEVEPLPPLFKQIIKRMVRWHVLPATCVPDSCIVNIYDEGDCIPPHIDHHDFARPYCTISLISDCNILFGSYLKIVDAGEFEGPAFIPLPVGSVLIFNGNGANIAKHCISAVSTKRISITFRKMDDRKLPYKFHPDPEMQRITPLACPPEIKLHTPHDFQRRKYRSHEQAVSKYSKKNRKRINSDEFFAGEKGSFRPARRARIRY